MTDTATDQALEEIRTMSVNELSGLADCCCPDTMSSPGAYLLSRVRDGIVEGIRGERVSVAGRDDSDSLIHEVADNAPSVYTSECWAQFIDLGAYQEDRDGEGWEIKPGANLTMDLAMVALYDIAYRLATALVERWRESWQCPVCGEENSRDWCTPELCMTTPDDSEEEGDQDTAASAPEVPVEPLPVRTPGATLTGDLMPAESILTGPVSLPPVSDPILDLIAEAERMSDERRVDAMVAGELKALSAFRDRVWTIAGVACMLVILTGLVWIGLS